MIWRSRIYREFIQLKPCFVCETDPLSQAHHHSLEYDGIKSGKRPDTQCLPTCGKCHDAVERRDWGYLAQHGLDTYDALNLWARRKMVQYLTEFLEKHNIARDR